MSDKAAKLRAMMGHEKKAGDSSKSKKPKVRHFKQHRQTEITPTEFLELAMTEFVCELEGTHKVMYTLHRKTEFCLTYVASIAFQNEVVIAPVYIFKRPSSLQRHLMDRIYLRSEEEPWQVISGSHYHHEHGEQIIRNEIDPFLVPLKLYFGFNLYQPIQ